MVMKNDPEVTHNNSHVGFKRAEQGHCTQQTLVLYQTPAQQIFQPGIATTTQQQISESCIEKSDVKTRCDLPVQDLKVLTWHHPHDSNEICFAFDLWNLLSCFLKKGDYNQKLDRSSILIRQNEI